MASKSSFLVAAAVALSLLAACALGNAGNLRLKMQALKTKVAMAKGGMAKGGMGKGGMGKGGMGKGGMGKGGMLKAKRNAAAGAAAGAAGARIPVSQALGGTMQRRRLQEEPTSLAQPILTSLEFDRLFNGGIPSVGIIAGGIPSLLAGGWRTLGKKINQDSIPSIYAVLGSLTYSRNLVHTLSTQLEEVNAVIDNIPNLTKPMPKVEGEKEQIGQEVKFIQNWNNTGIFGIKGYLGTLKVKTGGPGFIYFESPLFTQLSPWLRPRFLKGFSLSDISPSQHSGLSAQLQQAEHDVHQLGAQVDALTTIFSGGVDIPFVHSLFNIEQAFSYVTGSPGNVNYWLDAVFSLQMLKEDFLRLPISWALTSDQNSTVESAVETVDKLLSQIANNSGTIDSNFLADVSKSLGSLAKSILPLDGTSLSPSVNMFGLDLASHLGPDVEKTLSIPLRLSDLSFLQNGFGTSSSFVEAADKKPVVLGADATAQLATVASEKFVPKLLARTFGGIPAMVGEAVQIGAMLSSVADGLASSFQMSSDLDASFFQRISESVMGGSGVEEVLRRFLPVDNNESASKVPQSEGQMMGLVKLIQLENAMKTVQSIINSLSGPSEFVSKHLSPKEFQDALLSVFFMKYEDGGVLSMENSKSQSSSSKLLDVVAGSFMTLPREMADGISNGAGRFAQLGKFVELLKGPIPEATLEEPEIKSFVANVFDDHTVALFSASASLVEALFEAELITWDSPMAPCLTEAEVEATSALRAAALIGNPVDLLKAGEVSEAEMVGVLSPSTDALKSDSPLMASSPFCEQRRKAVALLGEWVRQTSALMTNVFADSLIETADSMESVIGNLTMLTSQLSKK